MRYFISIPDRYEEHDSQSSVDSDSWNRCVRLSIDNISRNKVSAVGTEKFQNRSKILLKSLPISVFRCIMFYVQGHFPL